MGLFVVIVVDVKKCRLMTRNYIMKGVAEDYVLVGHDTTPLSIRFGAFRRTGLPSSSRLQKSATQLRPTDTEFLCGLLFAGVPPWNKITSFYLLYESQYSVICVEI